VITKKIIVVAVIALLTIGAIVMRSLTVIARAETQTGNANPSEQSRWLRIEERAKGAEAGDPESVRALADEIFSQPHQIGTLPLFVKQPLEEQVIKAELDYRSGTHRAIKHSDVVQLINSLSEKLELPSYAKTSEHQILDMRFRSMQLTPRFMGNVVSERKDGTPLRPGDSVDSAMSPLQACYFAMFAIDAKLVNPEYQVPPDEWERHRYQKALETWQSHKHARSLGIEQKGTSTGAVPDTKPRLELGSSKKMELIRGAEASLLKLSPEESVSLAQSALETLGIAPPH
jgi:hypothetical protein